MSTYTVTGNSPDASKWHALYAGPQSFEFTPMSEFESQYGGVVSTEDGYDVWDDHPVDEGVPFNRVWSLIELETGNYLVSSPDHVAAVGYVVSASPYDDTFDQEFVLYDEGVTVDCPMCTQPAPRAMVTVYGSCFTCNAEGVHDNRTHFALYKGNPTPWGRTIESSFLAPGVIRVRVEKGGGILVDEQRNATIAKRVRKIDGWYSEGDEFDQAAAFIPEIFQRA